MKRLMTIVLSVVANVCGAGFLFGTIFFGEIVLKQYPSLLFALLFSSIASGFFLGIDFDVMDGPIECSVSNMNEIKESKSWSDDVEEFISNRRIERCRAESQSLFFGFACISTLVAIVCWYFFIIHLFNR